MYKYKARVIKQWWCARIHIFKMDERANEWIICKYASNTPQVTEYPARGRQQQRGGGGWGRRLRGAACQKVSDFKTWGLFVIIIISPARQGTFFTASAAGAGAGVGAVAVAVWRRPSFLPSSQTSMNYRFQCFRKVVLALPELSTFISFNFLEIFSSPSSLFFISIFFFLGRPSLFWLLLVFFLLNALLSSF